MLRVIAARLRIYKLLLFSKLKEPILCRKTYYSYNLHHLLAILFGDKDLRFFLKLMFVAAQCRAIHSVVQISIKIKNTKLTIVSLALFMSAIKRALLFLILKL